MIQATSPFHEQTPRQRRGAWLIPPLSDFELIPESRLPGRNAPLVFKLFILDGELRKDRAMRAACETVASKYPNASLEVIRAGIQKLTPTRLKQFGIITSGISLCWSSNTTPNGFTPLMVSWTRILFGRNWSHVFVTDIRKKPAPVSPRYLKLQL